MVLVTIIALSSLFYAHREGTKLEFYKQNAAAWQWEFNASDKYNEQLQLQVYELERQIDLCNDYVYPACPEGSLNLDLECSHSMLPEYFCGYRIEGFNLTDNAYPPKLCDIISFDIPYSITSTATNHSGKFYAGNTVNLSRIIHRVVGFNGSQYVTRGDALSTNDGYQPVLEDVRWVVCK
ncbi:MAG: hypothetical protein HY376_02975 [Candidatus Blackburnbacteria bacterium]|nr:hypothetical protein [Candidatus Blackburnbacteria bacterium]